MKLNIALGLLLTAVAGYAYSTGALFADHTHSDIEKASHSGGLDQYGGHYNRSTGEYHYHR